MIDIILGVFIIVVEAIVLWVLYRDRDLYSRHRDEAYMLFIEILEGADPDKEPYRSSIEDWVRAYQEE